MTGIVEYMRERSDSSWKPPPEQVVVLTKDNFSEVTENEDLTVVMFYAPWLAAVPVYIYRDYIDYIDYIDI